MLPARQGLFSSIGEEHGMRITRWGEYGILCSLYVYENAREASSENQDESSPPFSAASSKTTGAADISEKLSIPIQYTQQILQRLRKGGIVDSVRGPRGGYRLAKEPDLITLKDILFAMEGNTFQVVCEDHPLDAELCCQENFCGLKEVWYDLRRTIDDFFSNINLVKLAKNHNVKFPETGKETLVALNDHPLAES